MDSQSIQYSKTIWTHSSAQKDKQCNKSRFSYEVVHHLTFESDSSSDDGFPPFPTPNPQQAQMKVDSDSSSENAPQKFIRFPTPTPQPVQIMEDSDSDRLLDYRAFEDFDNERESVQRGYSKREAKAAARAAAGHQVERKVPTISPVKERENYSTMHQHQHLLRHGRPDSPDSSDSSETDDTDEEQEIKVISDLQAHKDAMINKRRCAVASRSKAGKYKKTVAKKDDETKMSTFKNTNTMKKKKDQSKRNNQQTSSWWTWIGGKGRELSPAKKQQPIKPQPGTTTTTTTTIPKGQKAIERQQLAPIMASKQIKRECCCKRAAAISNSTSVADLHILPSLYNQSTRRHTCHCNKPVAPATSSTAPSVANTPPQPEPSLFQEKTQELQNQAASASKLDEPDFNWVTKAVRLEKRQEARDTGDIHRHKILASVSSSNSGKGKQNGMEMSESYRRFEEFDNEREEHVQYTYYVDIPEPRAPYVLM